MATDLIVHGPFKIPFTLSNADIKCIETTDIKEFWSKEETSPFVRKQGVYVFAIQASKGFKPVYIGKATKGFRQEAFQSHKLAHYGRTLADGGKGTPVMFFVAPGDKLNKVPTKTCDEIETFMIQLAVRKNPELRNDRKTTLAEWSIRGLVRGGKGKTSKPAASFSKMIGM